MKIHDRTLRTTLAYSLAIKNVSFINIAQDSARYYIVLSSSGENCITFCHTIHGVVFISELPSLYWGLHQWYNN